MASEGNDYREQLAQLGLTSEQGKELIGALTCIIESLLTKKYMIGVEKDEATQSTARQ
jgi:hypothetical protein